MANADFEKLFHEVLTLQGKSVEILTLRNASKLKGTIAYTMFDSLLLDTNGKRQVVAFKDIAELEAARG